MAPKKIIPSVELSRALGVKPGESLSPAELNAKIAEHTKPAGPPEWKGRPYLPPISASTRTKRERAKHPLNDRLIRLKNGAVAMPELEGGYRLVGGEGVPAGRVWSVSDGAALIDFGTTSGGDALHAIAPVSGLEVIE